MFDAAIEAAKTPKTEIPPSVLAKHEGDPPWSEHLEIEKPTYGLAERQSNPATFLSTALSSGLSAEVIEKLTQLYNDQQDRDAERAFIADLVAAQAEMPRVIQNKVNADTRKPYADLEAVNTVFVPIFTKHSFSLAFGTEQGAAEGLTRVVCDLSHREGHTRRYSLDIAMDTTGIKGSTNKTAVQGLGSSLSYARRYLTLMIGNCTVSGEDNDGRDSRTVSDEQIAILNEWLSTTDTKLDRFLAWAGINSLDQMLTSKFDEAIVFFKRKAR